MEKLKKTAQQRFKVRLLQSVDIINTKTDAFFVGRKLSSKNMNALVSKHAATIECTLKLMIVSASCKKKASQRLMNFECNKACQKTKASKTNRIQHSTKKKTLNINNIAKTKKTFRITQVFNKNNIQERKMCRNANHTKKDLHQKQENKQTRTIRTK